MKQSPGDKLGVRLNGSHDKYPRIAANYNSLIENEATHFFDELNLSLEEIY